MEARAKILGHPVHQMLIVLPLGALVGVVIFDLIGLFTGSEQFAIVSYWLIPLGIVSGLIAAIFGLADWTAIPQATRARRVGLMHGIGNVVVLLLFAMSWLMRTAPDVPPSTLAVILGLLGAGVAGFTGWLGGELVNQHAIGVNPNAHPDAPSSLSQTT